MSLLCAGLARIVFLHQPRPFAAAAVLASLLAPGCSRAPRPAPSAPAAAPSAGQLPPGLYHCYTYHPGAIHVGTIRITDDGYEPSAGASGRYRLADGNRVDFLGNPPLGFGVGVLEERGPAPKLRVYRDAGDIGNTWKAAVCTLSGGGDAESNAPAPAAVLAFAPGTKVEANFLGYWYGATVERCEAARCLVHYDDPSSKDEWVDVSRLRAR